MTQVKSFWPRFVSARSFWIAVSTAMVVFLIAVNAHFVAVAFKSQPECVAHTKVMDDDVTTYRAAKSSCRKATS